MNTFRCWAAPLEDCEGKTSREHYVSEAFFAAPAVQIQGLPWCKGEAKTVGIGAATARILCERHNSRLSPLDSEVGAYMNIIREHLRLGVVRSQPRFAPFHVRHFEIDARLLERWLLKVLLNLTSGSNLRVGPDGEKPGVPSRSLVETCFGLRPFENRSGMYVGSYAGMSLEMGETLTYAPLLHDGDRVVGGFFVVAGIHYLLALSPAGPPPSLRDISGLDSKWASTLLRWRFREITVEFNRRKSHVIRFNWHAA